MGVLFLWCKLHNKAVRFEHSISVSAHCLSPSDALPLGPHARPVGADFVNTGKYTTTTYHLNMQSVPHVPAVHCLHSSARASWWAATRRSTMVSNVIVNQRDSLIPAADRCPVRCVCREICRAIRFFKLQLGICHIASNMHTAQVLYCTDSELWLK